MGKGNDFWLDDPEWELLRRKAEKRPIPKKLKHQAQQQSHPRPKLKLPREEPRVEAKKEETPKEVVVSLKLAVPKVKLPDFKGLHKDNRKKVWAGGAALLIVIVVFAGLKLLDGREGKVAGVSDNPSEAAQQEAEADFDPLVPLENLADASGKQSKPEFKYDQEKKVLGYVAEFNTANLTISQQQVPEDFKSNPAKLMSVADSIKASKHIETQKGTAYIATDDKTKAQMAVFATDDVLVFIRSNKQLDEDEWKLYINQLNPAE